MAPTSLKSSDENQSVEEQQNSRGISESRHPNDPHFGVSVVASVVVADEEHAEDVDAHAKSQTKEHVIAQETNTTEQVKRPLQVPVWVLNGNLAFQHFYYNWKNKQKNKKHDAKCKMCYEPNKLLTHMKSCRCKDCSPCNMLRTIQNYHKSTCKLFFCKFCADIGFPKCNSEENHEPGESSASLGGDTITDEIVQIGQSPLVGTRFNEGEDWWLTDFLGNGGYGVVFGVELGHGGKEKLGVRDGKLLAAKRANVNEYQKTVLRKLETAPNIIHHYFIVHKPVTMPWINGKPKLFKHLIFMQRAEMSLKSLRKTSTNNVLCLQCTCHYGRQILENLAYMHGLDPPIVHKDLKPDNVLVKDGRVYLADYEFAIMLTPDLETEKLAPAGTKFFVAPEVLEKKPHGTATDVYSFGTSFLALSIPAKSFPTISDKILRLKALHSGIGELIESCVKVDPKKRPIAEDVLKALTRFAEEQGW